mmetsp:Transcript_2446/g.6104  ORF Transcript_2446/g.6104 Transcript_2446/m.6104 type:complete len:115 (-) Transcript_2446:164-508(-)
MPQVRCFGRPTRTPGTPQFVMAVGADTVEEPKAAPTLRPTAAPAWLRAQEASGQKAAIGSEISKQNDSPNLPLAGSRAARGRWIVGKAAAARSGVSLPPQPIASPESSLSVRER